MNRLIQARHDLLEPSLNLRAELLDMLGDADLACHLPGNPSLSGGRSDRRHQGDGLSAGPGQDAAGAAC